MSRTDDPMPQEERAFSEYIWPVVSATVFEGYEAPVSRPFVDVFERRRSARTLDLAPIELAVGALLFALVPRYRKEGDALKRSRRPSLSAGALHPISVILFHNETVFRLNADLSSLETLAFPPKTRGEWTSKCRQVVPTANGTFIALVADLARPNSAYANAESLMWRDAGAMLQTMAYAAELFGLGFCPLGIIGNEVVSGFPASEQLLAVGAAVIGRPAKEPQPLCT